MVGHNPDRHNPDRMQPGQKQPGKTQPGQDLTWTGRNLDRHNQDRDTTRTRTDSVSNMDIEKIISEYMTNAVLYASFYSDFG